MKAFINKRIFITGGSSGIGLAAAKQLAEKGAHVTIFARDKDRLETARAEITRHGRSDQQQFFCSQLDVSDGQAVTEVMTKAVDAFGTPDILINCAGRAYPRYFEDITLEQFDETMKINLYGIWHSISVLLPFMKEKGGHIVNVSSIAGLLGLFGYTDYCASKFAIVGLSEALKSELKKYNINVSVLCPPDTDTPGFAVENKTKPLETQTISKGAKVMTPDEVASQLLKGIVSNTFLIIPGKDGKFTWLMKRLFPGLVDYLIQRTIKKVQLTSALKDQRLME